MTNERTNVLRKKSGIEERKIGVVNGKKVNGNTMEGY